MKKILLTLALAGAAAFGASAQVAFSNCYTVKYNGNTCAPGEQITCNHFQDLSDLFGDGCGTFECNLDIENLDIMPGYINATLSYSNPTYAEQQANPWEYGDAQLCYARSATPGGNLIGNCLLGNPPINCGSGTEMVPAEGAGEFQWQIHLTGANQKYEQTYILTLQAVEEDGTVVSEAAQFPIFFSTKEDSGVAEIVAAEGEGVWYDLQGRRVENPAKGLYIYKTANKTVKALVK